MLRRLALAALAILATGSTASADWAQKMFKEFDHDFGSVARDSKTEYAFELENLYMEDVHIAAVRSSCGCTSPRIEKEWLKTYESGAIVCHVNTDRFLGQKGATVTVTIDKPYWAEVQLHVKAYILNDVVVQPGSVQFGEVDQGTPGRNAVTISHSGRSDWKVLEVRSSNPYLTAELVEKGRVGGQVTYELTSTLSADAPTGYLQDRLMLVTNDSYPSQVPVRVEAHVRPSVTVSPGSLFMGVVKPGQRVTKQLVVRGKQPFKIEAIECDDASFEFDPSVLGQAKPLHLVPITFIAGDTAGRVVKKIRIVTDQGESSSELPALAVVTAE